MNEIENSEITAIGYKNPPKQYSYKPGQSGNLEGRPKNTLKQYSQRKFSNMTDKQKETWLKTHKVSGIDEWKMAEGLPKADIEHSGNLTISQVLDQLENGQETSGQKLESKQSI